MKSTAVLRLSSAVVVAALGSATAIAADADHSFEIYGFAQADYIQDFGGRLDPSWDDAFRPSKIGIDGAYGTDGQSSISVKQSRFGVKGTMPTGGSPITFKFEFDLFGTGADAGQTTFRLRHMYGEWGSILAGQTNSLFMDGDVFPNTIDYWGPAGMVFYRNVQIRWTPFRNDNGHFAIAIERPGNDVDAGNIRLLEGFSGAERAERRDHARHHRAVARQRGLGPLPGRRHPAQRRAMSSGPHPPDSWNSGSETGWGINLGAAFNVLGSDKILLQVVYGDGIASYMNDGGMDLAPQVVAVVPSLNVTSKAVPLTGVVAYYDHTWNEKWTSSIGYSYTEVDNTNFQDGSAFQKGEYASVNLLATPAKNVMVGGELLWGKRTNNDGSSGDDMRFQFTVKYNFSSVL